MVARLAKTGRKTRKNVIYGHTNELITWRCRGLSYCQPTASTALSIACSSSITIKRDVLLHVHTAPDPVRLVIAYQHLFQLGPWRGIVIYQPFSRSRACVYARALILCEGSGHQTTPARHMSSFCGPPMQNTFLRPWTSYPHKINQLCKNEERK